MSTAGPGGRACVVAGAALLSGCGFHPLYAHGTGQVGRSGELAAIDVALHSGPARPVLRQALQQRLDRGEGVAKRYTLSVSFGVAGDAIAIQRDSTATRVREVATATWTLKALDPAQTVVTNGTARALDGVNVIDQQYFAADLEGETATKRISRDGRRPDHASRSHPTSFGTVPAGLTP